MVMCAVMLRVKILIAQQLVSKERTIRPRFVKNLLLMTNHAEFELLEECLKNGMKGISDTCTLKYLSELRYE